MIDAESSRIIDLAIGATLPHEDKDFSRLTEALCDFAEDTIAKPELFSQDDTDEEIREKTKTLFSGKIESIRESATEEEFSEFERRLSLAAIDELWMQHIDRMAHLREEVAFEWYAQKNPLVIYREKAYGYFIDMIRSIEHRVVKWLLTAKPKESLDSVNLEETLLSEYAQSGIASHQSLEEENTGLHVLRVDGWTNVREKPLLPVEKDAMFENVGRNDPCPCGSGKKYKNCHGK